MMGRLSTLIGTDVALCAFVSCGRSVCVLSLTSSLSVENADLITRILEERALVDERRKRGAEEEAKNFRPESIFADYSCLCAEAFDLCLARRGEKEKCFLFLGSFMGQSYHLQPRSQRT